MSRWYCSLWCCCANLPEVTIAKPCDLTHLCDSKLPTSACLHVYGVGANTSTIQAIRDEGKYGIPRYTLLLRTLHDYSDYDSGMVPPRNKPILKGFARIWFWDIACVQSPFDRCWCRHLTILTRCRLNPRVFARVFDGSSPPCARQHQCEGPMSPNRHLVQLREPRCFFLWYFKFNDSVVWFWWIWLCPGTWKGIPSFWCSRHKKKHLKQACHSRQAKLCTTEGLSLLLSSGHLLLEEVSSLNCFYRNTTSRDL